MYHNSGNKRLSNYVLISIIFHLSSIEREPIFILLLIVIKLTYFSTEILKQVWHVEFRHSPVGDIFIRKSPLPANRKLILLSVGGGSINSWVGARVVKACACTAAGGGGPARGARVPHGGAGGLPGRPLRGDARRLARRPGAAAQLRPHAPASRRHPRPGAPHAAPRAAAPGTTRALLLALPWVAHSPNTIPCSMWLHVLQFKLNVNTIKVKKGKRVHVYIWVKNIKRLPTASASRKCTDYVFPTFAT